MERQSAGRSPDSPRSKNKAATQPPLDRQQLEARQGRHMTSEGNSLYQQSNKVKRQDSPPRNNPKQNSFTKFPPLRKNTDEIAEIDHRQSEKQNENAFKQVHALNLQKKKVEKKKILLMNPVNLIASTRLKQYKQFLGLVNLSNNLRIVNEKAEMKPYVIHIGKGNNSTLIKNVIKSRPWWVITQDKDDPDINMVWTQIRQNEVLADYKSLKETDLEQLHFEMEDNIEDTGINTQAEESDAEAKTTKTRLFNRSKSVNHKDNMSALSQTVKQKRISSKSKQKDINGSKVITAKELKEVVQVEKEKNTKLANPRLWINYQNMRRIYSQKDMKSLKAIGVLMEDGSIKQFKRSKMRCIENSSGLKMHNHLENNWHLSNKKALFYNMKSYYEAKKINPFEFIPITFHIEDLSSKEFGKFLEYYNQKQQQINAEMKKPQQGAIKPRNKKKNVWLVKPGENTNRGTGITVTESLQEITELIQSEKTDSMGRPRTHILQEYIMPFLYNKRKFDIRTYICVTSFNGVTKGYWFQQGYIRTACKQFNFKNLANKMIHLTNDAVQKKCEEYGKYEPGNKISFADFQRYLDAQQTKHKFYSAAYPEMKKLATDAIKAVYTKMDPLKKEFSFEVFGLDFMIDDNFKVWLIEANTNPCLELSSPLLGRIIPSMIENAFRIAVDPIFMPPGQNYFANFKRPMIPENMLENNRFELVFDEVEEGKELKTLLTNTPNIEIFDIEEEEEEENEEVEKSNLYLYQNDMNLS